MADGWAQAAVNADSGIVAGCATAPQLLTEKNRLMKTHIKLVLISLSLFGAAGCKEETVPEKAEAAVNDVSRTLNKAKHRVGEAMCLESDLECLAKKAANKIEEAADATHDAAKELKNTID